jgi:hypothetical protein
MRAKATEYSGVHFSERALSRRGTRKDRHTACARTTNKALSEELKSRRQPYAVCSLFIHPNIASSKLVEELRHFASTHYLASRVFYTLLVLSASRVDSRALGFPGMAGAESECRAKRSRDSCIAGSVHSTLGSHDWPNFSVERSLEQLGHVDSMANESVNREGTIISRHLMKEGEDRLGSSDPGYGLDLHTFCYESRVRT